MSDESQQDRRRFGTDVGEVRHEPAAARWQLRAYVAAVVLTPLVLVAGTTWWMSTGAYLRHIPYIYLADAGYGLQLHDAGCQVVVYGDSTALVGVSPSVIEQRTGLKTCNLAEVAGVQRINGLLVLEGYLRHNPRPRFLVFLYAPENLSDPAGWSEVSTFEGVFLRLQTRPDAAFWAEMLRHPTELTGSAELGFRTGVQWWLMPPVSQERLQLRFRQQGQVLMPGAAMTACPADVVRRAPQAAWLQRLRARYGVGGTTVLIDVTPEPPCDPSRPFYAAALRPGMLDDTLGTLPLAMYTDTGRLHTNEAGAEAISAAIAAQLLAAGKGGR